MIPRRIVRTTILLAALALARGASAAPPPARGPAVAVEDTMRTEVPPVLVNAPRVTLAEILDRVARGEAHRDSLLHDRAYLVTTRLVSHAGEAGRAELIEEDVQQVWQRRPGPSRVAHLRHWEKHPPKEEGKEGVKVEVRPGEGMSEEIVNFAFRPEARRQYRYRIAGRELRGDHLVYQLAFEPLSPLALDQPSGVVWVDTRDFVILRQELEFRQSPVPLFLRGIRRMVVEREPAGGLWMLSRVLVRIETTIPIPRYGRSFDFALLFSDYRVNEGIPDSVFAAPAKGAR